MIEWICHNFYLCFFLVQFSPAQGLFCLFNKIGKEELQDFYDCASKKTYLLRLTKTNLLTLIVDYNELTLKNPPNMQTILGSKAFIWWFHS